MKAFISTATAVTFALMIAAAGADLAFARGGPGGPGLGAGARAAFGPTNFPHGFTQGRKTGWNGASTPPGWSKGNKGNKAGWQGRTVPPGWRGL